MRPALTVLDRLLVRRDNARPRTCLNRHITNRHAAFHGHCLNGTARELDRIAGTAGSADLANDCQNDVLAADPEAEFARNFNAQLPRLALPQGLRRHHMIDLGRADPERNATKRAMRRGMGIATHQNQTRQGDALFGSDNMDDAMPVISHRIVSETHLIGGGRQNFDRFTHLPRRNVINRLRGGRNAVVRHTEQLVRLPQRQSLRLQGAERPEVQVVGQVAVYIKQDIAVLAFDDYVLIPDFLEKRLAHRAIPLFCRYAAVQNAAGA